MEVRRMDKFIEAEDVLFRQVYDELCSNPPRPPVSAGIEDQYDYQDWLDFEALRITNERIAYGGKKNG